jgi:hypothetical protein
VSGALTLVTVNAAVNRLIASSTTAARILDGRGSLEPGGQLVLTLKPAEQGATKADVAELTGRLTRIESMLSAAR